jgi:hypothetical protein
VSSRNQEPCWDTGDTLGWGKEPGRADTLASWITSPWKAPPSHNTLKEQVGHQPTRPLPCRPARTPTTHWPVGTPATTGGSSTTRHLGDADKQDWMLKE